MERVVTVGGNQATRPISDFYMYQRRGHIYYVDSTVTASGNGKSWAYAFKTITEAVAVAVAGDTIYIYSGLTNATQFNEAVAVTSLAGIRFIGGGSNPDQAIWTAPNTTAPALTFTASPDFLVSGIRFRPPLGNAAISLVGVSHNGVIQANRVQGKTGSLYGILTDGAQANVHVEDNEFMYINTASAYAIKGAGYVSGDPTGWVIERNKFHSNTNHLVMASRQGFIRENVFAAVGIGPTGAAALTVLGIDLSGGSSGVGANIVTRNDLGGLYHTACYNPAIATVGAPGSDEWSGNFCADRSHATQVDATTGISKLAPVA